MTRLLRLLVAAVLLALAVPTIGGAAPGAPPGRPASTPGDQERSDHAQVVEFWTHARVAQAVPRAMVLDPADRSGTGFAPVHHAPGHCGGPPGAPRDCPGDTTTTTTSTTITTTTTIPDDDGDTITVVTGARWTQGGDVAEATGKVLFALGNNYYVCSASVVQDGAADRSIVVTAAHCVYDERNNRFATNWVFIPNYDAAPAPLSTSNQSYCADTKHGCWTAAALFVHNGYASQSTFNSAATLYDFGFAMVREGGKTNAHLDTVVPPLAIEFTAVATNNTVQGWAFGYPAAQKYNGRELTYCANGATADPLNANATYRMDQCDMTGGSSGGPWLRDKTSSHNGIVFSVNSYGYRGVKAMHGPKFNATTQAVFDAARTGTTNTIVGGGV